MLKDINENLAAQNIISAEDIRKIRASIVRTYPNMDKEDRDKALAEVIQRVVTKEIYLFNAEQKVDICLRLFKGVLEREQFAVKNNDVFLAAINSAVEDREIIEPLTLWVNSRQNIHLKRLKLDEFVTMLKEDQDRAEQMGIPPTLNSFEQIEKAFDDLDEQERKAKIPPPPRGETAPFTLLNTAEPISNETLKPSPASAPTPTATTQAQIHEQIQAARVPRQTQTSSVDSPDLLYAQEQTPLEKERETTTTPGLDWGKLLSPKVLKTAIAGAVCLAVFFTLWGLGKNYSLSGFFSKPSQPVLSNIDPASSDAQSLAQAAAQILPANYQYQAVNQEQLQGYLAAKNSLLGTEPYLSTIINVSKEYNLNPLLLLAVAGQEQDFVPSDIVDAQKIAHNPFNVSGGWRSFSTSIDESARIAAISLIELSRERPAETDALAWINREYSKDSAWSDGVLKHLQDLETSVGYLE